MYSHVSLFVRPSDTHCSGQTRLSGNHSRVGEEAAGREKRGGREGRERRKVENGGKPINDDF